MDTDEDEPPVVTGRKAARSLRLFRGDGTLVLDSLKDENGDGAAQIDHPHAAAAVSPATRPDTLQSSDLNPVSSATFFAHHSEGPNQVAGSTQHLTADVEFDHSGAAITKIQKRPDDEKVDAIRTNPDEPVFPLAVELRPFQNKVGGHTAIFRFSRRAVCKALVNRENLWYETVEVRHPELLGFVPKYIGVLNVRYSSIIADDDLPPEVVLDDNRHIIPELLWKKYLSSAPSPTGSYFGAEPGSPRTNSGGSTSVNTDLQVQVLQEVFKPRRASVDHIFAMDDENEGSRLRKHTRFERYILLEDLTADMAKPCVLDLKMGTRQYGVEALVEKQRLQRLKCSQTTSRDLGVRMCGLQVWNKATEKFFVRDKYFGRRVQKGAEFCKVLAKFLYDGILVYSVAKHIPHVIDQLQHLYRIFEKLHGYRMYGLSILLMYDGMGSRSDCGIKVRIIDFAQSVIAGDDTAHVKVPPLHPQTPDNGYLRGLRSLMMYFETMFHILVGHRAASCADMEQHLAANRHKLEQQKSEWIDAYGEEDREGNDPFARDYYGDDTAEVSD